MPSMPPRPCTYPRCKNMSVIKGRCEDHKPVAWQSSESKTNSQRGYGSQWRKVRTIALRRDKHLCQVCLRHGVITPATQVDHIKNKASGGDDSLDNLQSICDSCHMEKTIKERV